MEGGYTEEQTPLPGEALSGGWSTAEATEVNQHLGPFLESPAPCFTFSIMMMITIFKAYDGKTHTQFIILKDWCPM